MEIKIKDLKDGDVVWGCAFDIDARTGHPHLRCKPVKGIITLPSRYGSGYFTQLKLNGEMSSKSVSLWARRYAKTEVECIVLYNSLIQDEIDRLKDIQEIYRLELL